SWASVSPRVEGRGSAPPRRARREHRTGNAGRRRAAARGADAAVRVLAVTRQAALRTRQRPRKTPPAPVQTRAGGPLSASNRTTTDFDVGVLDTSAVESNGTSTLVSGK